MRVVVRVCTCKRGLSQRRHCWRCHLMRVRVGVRSTISIFLFVYFISLFRFVSCRKIYFTRLLDDWKTTYKIPRSVAKIRQLCTIKLRIFPNATV